MVGGQWLLGTTCSARRNIVTPSLSKQAQIRSILAGGAPEIDIATAHALSKLIGVETFDRIYDVSVDEIVQHVAAEGWDQRVVQVTSNQPIYDGAGPSYYLYIASDGIKVMTPMDRGEWLESEFPDRFSAVEYVVKCLVWSKWSDINYEWIRCRIPNNTRPLKDIFPAPCGLKHENAA
jgi:hypothetical protein